MATSKDKPDQPAPPVCKDMTAKMAPQAILVQLVQRVFEDIQETPATRATQVKPVAQAKPAPQAKPAKQAPQAKQVQQAKRAQQDPQVK